MSQTTGAANAEKAICAERALVQIAAASETRAAAPIGSGFVMKDVTSARKIASKVRPSSPMLGGSGEMSIARASASGAAHAKSDDIKRGAEKRLINLAAG